MAHGNPRICFCKKCNMIGSIPRFSQNICTNCNNKVEQITKEELKKKLGLMIHESLPYIPFQFFKIKTK
jgi:uncharacterized paraquat-inducible protein A